MPKLMTIFKVLSIAALALSLAGCATRDIFNTTREIDIAGTCRHLKDENGKTSDVKRTTSEKEDIYDQTASKVFSGIKSANLNNSTLIVSLVNKGYFEQYSVPLVETIQQTTYDRHLTRATIATIIYIGIPWLITDHFSDLAFGCTEEKKLYTTPDLAKKTKTGGAEWRDIQKSHKFIISGFDKDYELDASHQILQHQVAIDLSATILNSDLTENTSVKITCLDCDLLGPEEQSNYKDVKKIVEINADFRGIKASLDKKLESSQHKTLSKSLIKKSDESGPASQIKSSTKSQTGELE
jgi:hypothetical protein